MFDIDEKTKKRLEELSTKTIFEYGVKIQEILLIEEMAELTQAICKAQRERYYNTIIGISPPHNNEAIMEEFTDVIIMLKQLSIIHKLEGNDLSRELGFKLDKLEAKLKHGHLLKNR